MKFAVILFYSLFLFFGYAVALCFESIDIFTEFEDDEKYLYIVGKLEKGFEPPSSNFFIFGGDFFLTVKLFSKGEIIFGRSAYTGELEDFSELTGHFASGYNSLRLTSLGGVIFMEDPAPVNYHLEKTATYEVIPGDYLYRIAQQNSSSVAQLELINSLDDANIKPGQVLDIGSVKFAESYLKLSIERDTCQLKILYDGVLLKSMPVAVGRNDMTPSGVYTIMRKIENPALYWEGEYISPLAPINGLGKWWIELSNPQYGIHGTNKPWETGKRISHGCIRMFNEDISNLQKIIPVGTEVEIK